MRMATMVAGATLVASGVVLGPAHPAVAGGYCRTNVPHVPVHAEPRGDSPVVADIPAVDTPIECVISADPAWWLARDDRDGRLMGFVEQRLVRSDCC